MGGGSYAGGSAVVQRSPEPVAEVTPPQRAEEAPAQWHRGLTLIATASLFIGTRGVWTNAMSVRPLLGAVISVCYASILVCGVLAFTVRGRRALTRVDAGVLATAVVLVACRYVLNHAGADEGVLTAQAAHAIDTGRPVYGQPWPWLFRGTGVALTKTMGGGADLTYAYPPLTALLTAPVHLVVHSTASATLVTSGALVVGAVLLWWMLPAPWRPAATTVCLGFDMLPQYAREGYPAMLVLALMVPVVVRWPETGAGGRLGRDGVVRAICLGGACASQQLAWFITPFLLVGLHAVWRGEFGGRTARVLLARYVGVALASFAVLNAYIAVQHPIGWLRGILLPLTQNAILHGQGVVDISYYFTSGSSRLDFYSYGSSLLLLGLVASTFLFARRLGPAITVLPWLSFYFATRSQDGYFLMLTPLWVAAVATVPGSALARAWQPGLPGWLRGRRAKMALAAGLVAPAVLCVGVAAASTPPLDMAVTPQMARVHRGVTSVTVHVTNNDSTALTPHFASRTGQSSSDWWTIVSGTRTLRPHASTTYVLVPPGGYHAFARHGRDLYLMAFTDKPMTVTGSVIPSAGAPKG